MASKASFLMGIFRRLFGWRLSMSRLMVAALLVCEIRENFPASAPTSIITFVCDRSMVLLIKLVSTCVRYLPMRVLAAFSERVSCLHVLFFGFCQDGFTERLFHGFYFNIDG
jgi:hypothetical protein